MGKLVTMVKLAMWLVFNTMVRSGTMVNLDISLILMSSAYLAVDG